ncbi:RsmD family RNA methyltransferase [Riemerella anatipestifer]|uniref:class I SAM-dependent methyltransferase n=1 Tax=Riemerella anatipestifer TaxID=34085 RepID=UPI0030BAA700
MKCLQRKEVKDFIEAHLEEDVMKILLKKTIFEGVNNQDLVQQIEGRRIARKKFPFLDRSGILFPPHLNLEQSSSQATASFKGEWFSGSHFLDLTSGFGIDAFFLSQNFKKVTLVEQNSSLLSLVEHNWTELGREADFINTNLETFLENNQKLYDLVYLDPARRDNNKNKKFLLEDLSPNILEIKNQLLEISPKVLVKLSPLIDIKYLISVLSHIVSIDVIAVKNEVKEVLVLMDRSVAENTFPLCRCFNLETNEPDFSFIIKDEENTQVYFSEAKKYLYIPNGAILKSGAFKSVAQKYQLNKLHINTHLYTSEEKILDFPGRVLEVEEVSSKEIKKGEQYNLVSKNYPLNPVEIKKKYKLKDGGQNYLIFTQTIKGKVILRSK